MPTGMWRALACVLMLGPATGCVFESSTSEASFKSSSRLSSSCSPGKEEETAYTRDVRDYTAAYVAARRDIERLERDVAGIAEGYGIADWERDPLTHEAIGQGIAKAGVDEGGLDAIATAMAEGDARRLRWLRRGYAARAQ